MAQFRFQVHDGHHSVAPEMLDLPDVGAAQREGARRAGAALILDARHLQPGGDWRLDVLDEAGTLLYRFDVALTAAPAVRG